MDANSNLRLVQEAHQSQSRTQVLPDKAAGWLFFVALAMAALTAVVRTLLIGFDDIVIERGLP